MCVFVCVCVCPYLWVRQAGDVGFEVVDDALGRSGQGGTTHQQHKQHDIWEGGCQVHHLECTQWAGGGGGGMWSGCQGDRRDTSVMSSNRAKIQLEGTLESWSLKTC